MLTIAIDGGTTNTRCRMLRDSVLIAAAARSVGVRDVAMTGSAAALRQAVADCITDVTRDAAVSLREVELICASGMLTSNVGLVEIPHVVAPAGRDDLARQVRPCNVADIAPAPIYMIPGVKTIPASAALENLAECDVLRGEESEAHGIIDCTGRTGALNLLLPGSHTKWLCIDSQSRIAASYTTIAGESMQSLAQHTILANSIEWPPRSEPDWTAVDDGATFARKWGILRGGFAVRLADIVVGASQSFRTWFFMGLVAGMDWDELTRWTGVYRDAPLMIGGREPLRSLYGHLAARDWSSTVEVLGESDMELAAARGAISIARRHKDLAATHCS